MGRPSSNAWKNPTFSTIDVAEIQVGATTVVWGHILGSRRHEYWGKPAGSEQKNTADKVGAMCLCMYRRPSNSGKAILEPVRDLQKGLSMITGSLVNRYSLLRDAAWDYYQSLPVQAALATMLFDTICHHTQLPRRGTIQTGGTYHTLVFFLYVYVYMYVCTHTLLGKYPSSVGTKAHKCNLDQVWFCISTS